MTTARRLAHVTIGCALAVGCALALGGARAAEVGASGTKLRPQTVHAGAVRQPIRITQPQRRTHPGGATPATAARVSAPGERTLAARAPTPAAAARPGTPLQGLRPDAHRSPTVLTAMARTAVIGGPRTQARGSLGGPQNSSASALRGSSGQGGDVQGGISGTALRRRY